MDKETSNEETSVQNSFSALRAYTSKKRMPRFPVFGELTLLGLVLLSVFFFPYLSARLQEAPSQLASGGSPTEKSSAQTDIQPFTPNMEAFEHVAPMGDSVIIWDIKTEEILFEKNADVRRPLASVTKLMTALVSHELLDNNAVITVPENYALEEYSALVPGDTFSARDLTDYTLLVSSNEGAEILGVAAARSVLGKDATIKDFVHAMNLRAEDLGFVDMEFNNPHGLDISETVSGGYSTAREAALLLEYIIRTYPDLLSATTLPEKRIVGGGGFVYNAQNTNGVVKSIPSLIASKTGWEELAGGNLAVAFNAGLDRPIIVVVLGSTRSGRFDDVLELVNATRNALSTK